MIIDAHLHLPVLKKGATFEQSKKKLLADTKNKIDYAILIPDNLHDSSIGDLDVSLELFEDEERIFLLGTINVRTEGKEWIDRLDSLFEEGRIQGIKIFPGHDPIYPTDERLDPVYELCLKHDSPIMIHTGWNSNHPEVAKYNDPKYIIETAQRYPELKIVIAHYFWPEVEYCYEITRGYKNIYFDTSGMADDEVIEATGLEKIKIALEKTIKDDPESVLFGTDYGMCDIASHINLINSLNISSEDKEKVFWQNAVGLFNLKIETE